MKNAWRATAIAMVLSVFAVAGCSSTQPDRIETRTSTLSLDARALTSLYDCYDMWRDNDLNGDPEENLFQVQCYPALENGVQIKAIRAVPWHYSLKVTVIHAGAVTEQVMISSDGATVGSSVERGDIREDFVSLTDYDPDQPAAPIVNFNTGNIYYLNGKRVSQGSPIYLATLGIDQGAPNILEILNPPETFDFNLTTGDTVIVRARKQLTADAPPFLPVGLSTDLKLTAFLQVSGVQVAIQGSTGSTAENAAGFTFSFTVQ